MGKGSLAGHKCLRNPVGWIVLSFFWKEFLIEWFGELCSVNRDKRSYYCCIQSSLAAVDFIFQGSVTLRYETLTFRGTLLRRHPQYDKEADFSPR